ncbi:hypothetical protein C8T65DRAFT_746939 [Cerioporus squamosus]|nr:hypothetical protein C8T65DRAFT_746939 [Cerioporus squamosus]
MAPSNTVTYPPAAHLSTEQPAAGAVTDTQPAPVAAMSLHRPPSRDNSKQTKAERIRGGCIPVPAGASATSSPSPAAAEFSQP